MATNLPWKAKDVRRLVPALLLLFIGHTALPQYIRTSAPKKVTITSKGVQFNRLIDKLSQITGLHFIYSSNKIEANKLVSLSVTDRPLEDVLLQLGRQMNLTFTRRDKYVIIKTITVSPASQAFSSTKRLDFDKVYNTPKFTPLLISPDVSYTASTNQQRNIEGPIASPVSEKYFDRHLDDFKVYFDTTFLRKLPAHEIQRINLKNRHSSWFISAGVMVNDFAAGAALQAGIRSLYLVYNPAWLRNGNFYGSYGLGTSVLLSRNISFNPVYSYGTLRQNEYISTKIFRRTIERDIELYAKHHQIRLMFQYSISKNINVRVGPTFSYLKTKYSLQKTNVMIFRRANGTEAMPPMPKPPGLLKTGAAYATTPDQSFAEIVRDSRDDYSVGKYMVGWEASLSYKINFFKRP